MDTEGYIVRTYSRGEECGDCGAKWGIEPHHPTCLVVKKVSNQGKKFDKDKLDWSVLDFDLIEPLVAVLKVGEQRYGYENWKNDFGPDWKRRFRAARLRHERSATQDSLAINSEDGNVYHLAQVAINALFELYHAKNRTKRQ